MATNYHHLFRCNNTIKEDDGTLPLSSYSLQHHHKRRRRHIVVIFFFSNTKKTKHTRKQQKEPKKREGVYLQAPTLPSHFWLPFLPSTFALMFQAFFPGIFLKGKLPPFFAYFFFFMVFFSSLLLKRFKET
jgi:hypothetical protein